MSDILDGLRYIADSPAREHGGFHPEAVKIAKEAIEEIEQLREGIEGMKSGVAVRIADLEAEIVRLREGMSQAAFVLWGSGNHKAADAEARFKAIWDELKMEW